MKRNQLYNEASLKDIYLKFYFSKVKILKFCFDFPNLTQNAYAKNYLYK